MLAIDEAVHLLFLLSKKRLKVHIAFYVNPSQNYGASLAKWDHSVSCHLTQANASRLDPSQPGRYSIYLPQRDERLS